MVGRFRSPAHADSGTDSVTSCPAQAATRARQHACAAKTPAVVLLIPPRWRDQCGQPVEQLERGEDTVADGDTQHASADPSLHGAERGGIEIGGAVEAQRTARSEAEDFIGDARVQVGVGVERGAEALHETDCAEAGRARRIGAAPSQAGFNCAQHSAPHGAEQCEGAVPAPGQRGVARAASFALEHREPA